MVSATFMVSASLTVTLSSKRPFISDIREHVIYIYIISIDLSLLFTKYLILNTVILTIFNIVLAMF